MAFVSTGGITGSGRRPDPAIVMEIRFDGEATAIRDENRINIPVTTATQTTTGTKFHGKCLALSGANYLDLGIKENFSFLHGVGTTGKWSIAFWYKPTAYGAVQVLFATTSSTATTNPGVLLQIDADGTLTGIMENDAAVQVCYVSTTTAPTVGEWHYLVWTYDQGLESNNMSLYVDGVLVDTGTKASGVVPSPLTTLCYRFPTFGAAGSRGSYYFTGNADGLVFMNGRCIDGTIVPTSRGFRYSGGPGGGSVPPDPEMTVAENHYTNHNAVTIAYARRTEMLNALAAWEIPYPTALIAAAHDVTTWSALTTAERIVAGGNVNQSVKLAHIVNSHCVDGDILYFPPGTYYFTTATQFTNAVSIVGSEGTIFNCEASSGISMGNAILGYNYSLGLGSTTLAGQWANAMDGITIYGITFNGPGIGTNPTCIRAYWTTDFHIQYCKFNNWGNATNAFFWANDLIVENCCYDNVYQAGYGYILTMQNGCRRTILRNNFCTTLSGRHGITTGNQSAAQLTGETYDEWTLRAFPREILVENCYFERSVRGAIDTHSEATGPIETRNCVFYQCRFASSFRGGFMNFHDNVAIGDTATYINGGPNYPANFTMGETGVYLYENVAPANQWANTDETSIISNNIFVEWEDNVIRLTATWRAHIIDNVMHGEGSCYGFNFSAVTGNAIDVLLARNAIDVPNDVSRIAPSTPPANVVYQDNWLM